ncbi:YeiH family protein [Corynebacterium halotolerans]|uniref:YeiH family protein n=1 Tax=Corynebacterium halotolerans TaxID=225326 RepID=UPI003CF0006F
MLAPDSHSAPTTSHRQRFQVRPLLPGVMLCLAAAALSSGLSLLLPGISALIIAIILGIILTNVARLPAALSPGLGFSSRQLLRIGIVLLGLKLVLSDIVDLGVPLLVAIIGIVTIGLFGTVLLGRVLRVSPHLTLLIACGFSICGAAAVVGAAGVTDPDDEAEKDTVTAVALVVIFGTLLIPLLPLAANLLGLGEETAGMWAGGSVHEVAQVVAIGGALGPGALNAAVLVKLARVLLLAPVVSILSVRQRRIARDALTDGQSGSRGTLPPLVPPFIIGFLVMVLLRSFFAVPVPVLAVGDLLQTGLLAATMFALGCGVKVRDLSRVGFRPFVLAALSTLLVMTVAFTGVTVVA